VNAVGIDYSEVIIEGVIRMWAEATISMSQLNTESQCFQGRSLKEGTVPCLFHMFFQLFVRK
jgi:hypothetical protein